MGKNLGRHKSDGFGTPKNVDEYMAVFVSEEDNNTFVVGIKQFNRNRKLENQIDLFLTDSGEKSDDFFEILKSTVTTYANRTFSGMSSKEATRKLLKETYALVLQRLLVKHGFITVILQNGQIETVYSNGQKIQKDWVRPPKAK